MKLTIEITKSKMVKELEFEGKTYKEEWHWTSSGAKTNGGSISSQLEEDGVFTDEMLEALENDDMYEIWRCLKEDY